MLIILFLVSSGIPPLRFDAGTERVFMASGQTSLLALFGHCDTRWCQSTLAIPFIPKPNSIAPPTACAIYRFMTEAELLP